MRFEPASTGAEQEEGALLRPKFGADGLIAAIARDVASGEVLMLAHMNALALEKTLETGKAHYWSRSRGELWLKGETSGNFLEIVDIFTDCDQDALLLNVRVAGDGAACHTGRQSCFYRRVETDRTGAPRLTGGGAK